MTDPVLSGLYGLRPDAVHWSDIAAALSIGLAVAALIGLLLLAFRVRRSGHGLARRITAARTLPDVDRAMVLCGLLRELTEHRAPGDTEWQDRAIGAFALESALAGPLKDLYRPGPGPDPDLLERKLLALVRQ